MSNYPKQVFMIMLFVGVIVFTAGCGGDKNDTTHDYLRQEFLDGCGDQSCWRGVRPGVTSAEDALDALKEANVSYDCLGEPQSDLTWNYVWTSDNETAPYGHANMNVVLGVVEQITFGIVVCPADFIDAFGSPDFVDGNDDSYGLWYNDELMMVVVHITETFPQFGGLYMFSAESYSEYIADILPVQIPWEDVKDILTQECND